MSFTRIEIEKTPGNDYGSSLHTPKSTKHSAVPNPVPESPTLGSSHGPPSSAYTSLGQTIALTILLGQVVRFSFLQPDRFVTALVCCIVGPTLLVVFLTTIAPGVVILSACFRPTIVKTWALPPFWTPAAWLVMRMLGVVVGYAWICMVWLLRVLRMDRTRSRVEMVDKALERVWHCQTWRDIEIFWMDILQRVEGGALEIVSPEEPNHDGST